MNAILIRMLAVMATVLAAAYGTPCRAQADDERWLHRSLAAAVEQVAAERALALDPALRKRIVGEGDMMMSVFCVSPEQLRRCRTELTAARVRAEVARHLGQLQQGSPEVRRIAASLALAIGQDLASAGEPSDLPNDTGLVLLPDDARGGTVLLSSAAGKARIGRAAGTVVLLPGTYRISVVDGATERSGTVNVARGGRVRLALSGSAAAQAAFGRLEPPDESFCFNRGDIRFNGPVAMFNWGRATIREPGPTKQAALAATATVPAVSVRLDDRAGGCGATCARSLGIAFAEAITTWKAGCERCDQNAMSVLTVGATTWVDGRIASRLRAAGSPPLDLNRKVPGESARGAPPSIVVTSNAIFGFEQVTGDTALTRAACAPGLDNGAPWVAALQAGVCGRSWGGVPRIQPVLRLLPGPTQCGPASDFLACGLPGRDIEISIAMDRFELSGVQPPLALGSADAALAIDLRAVILHEVGHWFGVPHFETTGLAGPDIMAETYGMGRPCVSGVSLMMLNNAADMRWEYRVSEGKGLRRPTRSRPPAATR